MAVAALLLSGCATPATQLGEHLPPAPAIDLGPVFDVLRAARGTYKVCEAMDGAGRAHLVIALQGTKEIRHFVIGRDGAVSGEIIRSDAKFPASLDLAFDRAGNLHALVDDEHLMKTGKEWVGSLRTPWKEAHIDLHWSAVPFVRRTPHTFDPPSFVKGAPDLTWAFSIAGGEMGLPTRTEYLNGGAAGPGISPGAAVIASLIPLPSFEQAAKLAVVPEETPYRHWNILGMEDDLDVSAAAISAVHANEIHAIYRAAHYNVLQNVPRDVVFRPDGDCAPLSDDATSVVDNQDAQQVSALKLTNGAPVCPIRGSTMAQRGFLYSWIAIDPDSGAALLARNGYSNLVGEMAAETKDTQMPIRNAGLLFAAAGKGRFHALATGLGVDREPDLTAPLYYLEYQEGAWSAPVEIGRYSTKSHWGMQRAVWYPRADAFKIVNDSNGHALLVWPTEDALVARWVALK